MEVTASRNEGLEREWKVRIPAEELSKRLDIHLRELQARANIKGFRPGKVPVSHLRQLYSKKLMSEIVDGMMKETSQRIVEESGLRPATPPLVEIETEEMEGGIEALQNGKGTLAYKILLEVAPEFELQDFTTLELTRKVAKISEEDIDSELENFAQRQRTFKTIEDKDAEAKEGDRVRLDFVGKTDGRPIENMEGKDALVEIVAQGHEDGFEKALRGRKVGESKIDVTFPKDHHDERLAGRNIVFDIDIKEIAQPQEVVIDEDFATGLGMENLEALRKRIQTDLAAKDAQTTRAKLKRQLLDKLAEQYSFELPSRMVKQQLQSISTQLSPATQEDEEKLKREYGEIAERRLRLAFVLGEIGQRNNIEVTSQELNHAVTLQAQMLARNEQKLRIYYRDHPEALETLRKVIFENKVVDFLLELAKTEEKEISRDELYQNEDEDGGDAKTQVGA